MNEYLIRAADPDSYPSDNYRSVIHTGDLDGDAVLDILHTENPIVPGDVLIGAWAHSGSQVEPLDQALYEAIRPLGNSPPRDVYDEGGNVVGQTRGGDASSNLIYHHFAGWGQRILGDDASEDSIARFYPVDTQPFAIEIRHKEWTGQVDPGWNGWGWRAEILGGAGGRDPSARAIGIYSDPECTQYLYTTGAFVQGPSDWQVDGNGDPLTVWFTETPLGRANPQKEDWHIACLLGAAQEGYNTLGSGEGSVIYLFWDKTQGDPGGGNEEYVDTGATVIAQAGTVYQISDAGVAASLVPGQQIRFGDDAETTFTGVWAGGADYIEIDPFVQAQVGDALWAKGYVVPAARAAELEWYSSNGHSFQIREEEGKWQIRWRKPNGDPSSWRRLAVFLQSSLFATQTKQAFYDRAVQLGYTGMGPT